MNDTKFLNSKSLDIAIEDTSKYLISDIIELSELLIIYKMSSFVNEFTNIKENLNEINETMYGGKLSFNKKYLSEYCVNKFGEIYSVRAVLNELELSVKEQEQDYNSTKLNIIDIMKTKLENKFMQLYNKDDEFKFAADKIIKNNNPELYKFIQTYKEENRE